MRYRDAMAVLDDALPDGATSSSTQATSGAAAIHLPAGATRRADSWSRSGWAVWATASAQASACAFARGAGGATVVDRGRRLILHARHGDAHRRRSTDCRSPSCCSTTTRTRMCVTREQLFYDDQYSYNRFRPSHLGAGLAAMFPDCRPSTSTTLDDLPTHCEAALNVDGPSVVSIECSADEIPPFAPFLSSTATAFNTKESQPMSLPALEDITPTALRHRRGHPHRDMPRGRRPRRSSWR